MRKRGNRYSLPRYLVNSCLIDFPGDLINESTEKSSRSRPRVRQSARGRASEQAFFRGAINNINIRRD